MKNKAIRIAYYLQRLSETKFKGHDEESFTEACKERGIPTKHISPLKDIIFPKMVTNVAWPPP